MEKFTNFSKSQITITIAPLIIGIKDIGSIKAISIQKLDPYSSLFVGNILVMEYLNIGNGLLH